MRTTINEAYLIKGVGRMKPIDLVYQLAYKLGWYAKDQARVFVRIAIEEGHLVEEDGFVSPGFTLGDRAGSGFKPYRLEPDPPQGAPPPDPFRSAVARIADQTSAGKREVVATINHLQSRLGINAAVAAILHARDLGIDVDDLATIQMERQAEGPP